MSATLILVGCGKMGSALFAGWLDNGVDPACITIVEPNLESLASAKEAGVTVLAEPGKIPAGFSADVIVFAVKPQMMDAVAPVYAKFAGNSTVFLSIAAGRTLASFEALLGPSAAVVRSMPNTPAAVRRGITVACANRKVTEARKRLCHGLLKAVGDVAWVDDEALMDSVTAVSGSGPAYVFLLAEFLAQAGIEAGLAPDLSARLARATVSGAGELLQQASEPLDLLRRNVTSPGGTTAEALAVLMGPEGLQPLLVRAVIAAKRRSQELAG